MLLPRPVHLQPEVQFGTAHQARSVLRVMCATRLVPGRLPIRLSWPGRLWQVALSYRAGDEAGARKVALEAAVKDAPGEGRNTSPPPQGRS